MSNPEASPQVEFCDGKSEHRPQADAPQPEAVAVEIITARDVPLGGPRAMNVKRSLPQKKRSLIGAWCFADHYGPDDVSVSGGMDVAPHPHTGLQTVSWLFEGEIQHIDSGGNRGMVLPGEINLMTAGNGICHSEVSTDKTTTLHGVQLWLALPDAHRSTAPRAFEHYAPTPVSIEGGEAVVFLGSLAGSTSPVETFTPLVGAEVRIEPNSSVTLELNPEFEHGVLVDAGDIKLEGVDIPRSAIGYTGVGEKQIRIENTSAEMGRIVLIGGEPFGEDIVMWWNFVGRTTEEIRAYRESWQERSEQFGVVEGYVGHGGVNEEGLGVNKDGMSWLPAPTLPNVTLRSRKNPAPHARPDEPEPGSTPESTSHVF